MPGEGAAEHQAERRGDLGGVGGQDVEAAADVEDDHHRHEGAGHRADRLDPAQKDGLDRPLAQEFVDAVSGNICARDSLGRKL